MASLCFHLVLRYLLGSDARYAPLPDKAFKARYFTTKYCTCTRTCNDLEDTISYVPLYCCMSVVVFSSLAFGRSVGSLLHLSFSLSKTYLPGSLALPPSPPLPSPLAFSTVALVLFSPIFSSLLVYTACACVCLNVRARFLFRALCDLGGRNRSVNAVPNSDEYERCAHCRKNAVAEWLQDSCVVS